MVNHVATEIYGAHSSSGESMLGLTQEQIQGLIALPSENPTPTSESLNLVSTHNISSSPPSLVMKNRGSWTQVPQST